MKNPQIRYGELGTLAHAAQKIAAFRAILSVIPDRGCRLFVDCGGHSISVVEDDGEPKFFSSVELALIELARVPGVDHHVTVDIISLLPRAMTRIGFLDGIVEAATKFIGLSRPGGNSSELK